MATKQSSFKSCDCCSCRCTFWSCTFNFLSKKVLKQSKMNSDKPTPPIEVKWWYVVTASVTIPCFCPRHSHGSERAKHAKNWWDWIQEYPYRPCVWWERNILSTNFLFTNFSYNAFTAIGASMKSNTIVMRKTKQNCGIHFIKKIVQIKLYLL